LADYVAGLKPFLPDDFKPVPLPVPKTVTYWGQREQNAVPNPTISVCLFPVIDPGQTYGDATMAKLMDQIDAKSFDRINDYYDECSFGEADYQFTTFGHDIGGARRPLVLPRAVASYWYETYRGGGLKAVMPADWTSPVAFDGTEALQVQANPRAGSVNTYDIPFAAMWTSRSLGTFPVNVDFAGGETVDLAIETLDGDSHPLTLSFGALGLTLNQADDPAPFLTALAGHVTAAIRAAESALPGSPVLIQDVVYRRERSSSDPTQFGRLQGQFRSQALPPASVTQMGRISVSSGSVATVLGDIGLSAAGDVPGVMTGAVQVSSYFRECLRAARVDAGEGIGGAAAYFNTSVATDEDAAAQEIEVGVSFTDDFGGNGATMEVVSSSGLAGTGWDTAQPDPGSESDPNNTNTLRDSVDLANDTFTAACQHIRDSAAWNRAAVEAMFAGFDVMMITHIGAPHSGIPAADAWSCDEPADFSNKRMYKRTHFATDLGPPGGEDPVQMGTSAITGQNFTYLNSADLNDETGVMAHELGHALGLPDLYRANGYRDDVKYVDPFAMMAGGNGNFHHFCGWSKWSLDWIADDPDPDVNRTIFVDLPAASGTSTTDAWLVPVEYWDNAMRTDVRAEVGGTVEIAQLMKLNLGSDGGVTAFLELRARGSSFSQLLSPQPTVIATNGLDPESDREWAVNGLYRRSVHLLNDGNELVAAGDTWDFASAPEFPVKGTVAEIVDTRTVRGSIPVWRVRVTREQAEYIDLHFQDHVPSWKSPDIWVDWAGDNTDLDVPREYPIGSPTDQGETVRFPSSGTEKHYVVARVHNAGNAAAEEVKVRWFVCDPPGAGDDGRWVNRGTRTIPLVGAGDNELAVFDWDVDSTINDHQCMRMEIIDWTIPDEIDPATGDTVALASDDVKLQNNNAQQNVFDFEAYSGSPFDPVVFPMQVHNDRNRIETAALVPQGLPYGSKLTISPREWRIPPGEARVFNCTLELDEAIIRPGCDNDSGFLLTAWRRGGEADTNWGSCFYHIRPRYRTRIELVRGTWFHGRVTLHGLMQPLTDAPLDLSEDLPLVARVRMQIDGDGAPVVWKAAPIAADGSFSLDVIEDRGKLMIAQAWFDRTDRLGSSVSNELSLKQSFLE
jgi:M6 family metalloprotease-like protein